MCSNLRKASILRQLSVRYSSTCPESKAAPVGGISEYNIETTCLSNKLMVTSAENGSVISRVGIAFRAGSRYEFPDNLGSTHMLRIAAGLSTHCASQFAITRNLQEVGATVTCSVDRELITYILEGPRPAVESSMNYLYALAAHQIFHPWELSDNLPRVKLELATRAPQLRAVDLLHKAAFRSRGLGNSLYIAKHNLGKITQAKLQCYVATHFCPPKGAVVGLGVNHKDLVQFADSLQLNCGSDKKIASPYKGGEIRSDKGGDLAHIAVGTEGASLSNSKEVMAFGILQRILGTGTYIKYGNEYKSPFGQLLGCSPEVNLVTALNVSYSDTGLFGALITSTSSKAGFFLESVIAILRRGVFSDEDFIRGKTQYKSAVTYALESGLNGIEASQALLTGRVLSPSQIICAIDCITKEDVQEAAKKVACGKFSVASIGTLNCVPFLDEIGASC